MTGWRIGFAVGNAALVGGLGKVKTNTDSGAFEAVQAAAVAALSSSQELRREDARASIRERREVCAAGSSAPASRCCVPKATFYVLVVCPKGLHVGGVRRRGCSTRAWWRRRRPASAPCGEGYVRLTLCADKARLAEAAERVQRARV